jgi:lipopolysaccharide transport system permease protein
MFSDLVSALFLGKQLFIRDVKGMFRQSMLGVVWAFIPPFFTAAAWVFLKFSGAVQILDTGIPYPIYVLTGTILFQTLSETFRMPSETVNKGKSMLIKLNFPRESLLISSFFQILFNLSFKLFALLVLSIAMGISFTWSSLLFLPAILAVVLFGFSIGVFIIPFQMLYTDFSRAIALFMQVMMYLTPVVYPYPTSGILLKIVPLNPFTPLIEVPRNWLTGQDTIMLGYFFSVIGIGVLVLFLGWLLYRITMPIIIERAGS